jgi:hypothetical protein
MGIGQGSNFHRKKSFVGGVVGRSARVVSSIYQRHWAWVGLVPGSKQAMRIGSLVKFTTSVYRGWGLGLILREYDMVDRDGRKHPGYYHVMTQVGEKLVSDSFMEELSVDPVSRAE